MYAGPSRERTPRSALPAQEMGASLPGERGLSPGGEPLAQAIRCQRHIVLGGASTCPTWRAGASAAVEGEGVLLPAMA